MRVLVVNAGSSTVKLSVLDETDDVSASRTLPAPRGLADERSVAEAIEGCGSVDAVGHRIVHGGDRFVEPVLLDGEVLHGIESLVDLAPLHLPKSLRAMEVTGRCLPGVPAVACFDTAFHARLPPEARTYALPREWRERWNLRRYGFHGLSHSYAARRAAELIGAPLAETRTVTCHLGSGASLAAVRGGRSVDTTMGFTPLEGLVMGTRSGSVDPGLVLWLEEHAGTPPSQLASTLEHRSGLLGLAGSADMREVLAAESAGSADAALAVGVYLHRLRGAMASMAAAMGGLDALVFTGGVGENAPSIRRRAGDGLEFLGVGIDAGRNEGARPDSEIGMGGAAVRTFVVEAREDIEVARGVRKVLDEG